MNSRVVEFAYFLLRVVTGFLFIFPGAVKLFGWPMAMPKGAALTTQLTIAGYMEVIGGALIILGLLTRPVAFLLAGEMAVAYFQAHQPNGTWPIQNNGQPAVLFCFIFLYIAARGGGPYSLDAIFSRSKPSARSYEERLT